MQESAEPTLCLSSSSFYLPSISTGQQEIDRYKESEREREMKVKEKKRGARTKLLKRDTAISLLKERGESPPRSIVPFCIIRASLLMSKLASSVLLFPSIIATFVV